MNNYISVARSCHMTKRDPALIFAYPRLLSTIYYGLLSVVGTILINAFLTTIGIENIVPLFQAIILGMVVASITGALCGKKIIYCPWPYKRKTFLIGFMMVLLSLPFFGLGLELFMIQSENPIIKITNFSEFVSAYVIILGYSYILFGFLLAIASGIFSVYLRDKFVYYVLHTDRKKSHRLPQYVVLEKKQKQKAYPISMKKTEIKPK